MQFVKYLLIFIAALIIFCILALTLSITLGEKDIEKVEFVNIPLDNFSQNDNNNALPYLLEAARTLHVPESTAERINYLKTIDSEYVLDQNRHSIENLDNALECTYFQILHSDEDISPYPIRILQLFALADLNNYRSRKLFENNQTMDAYETALKTIQLGHMIEGSGGGSIIYIVGARIKRKGCSQLIKYFVSMNADPALLNSYIDKLAQYHSSTESLIKSFIYDYRALVKGLDNVIKENQIVKNNKYTDPIRKRNPFFKPNKTRAQIAAVYEEMMQNVSKHYSDIQFGESDDETKTGKLKRVLFSGNIFGELISDLINASDFRGVFKAKCNENVYVDALGLLLSLKCYEQENGQLPGALNQLVPQYIKHIPEDDFDGETLRYSPMQKCIYSVGEDLLDGKGHKDTDIVFQIEQVF